MNYYCVITWMNREIIKKQIEVSSEKKYQCYHFNQNDINELILRTERCIDGENKLWTSKYKVRKSLN